MRKGVKFLVGFVLVVSLIIMLNSCGGQKTEQAPPPAQKAQQPEQKAPEPAKKPPTEKPTPPAPPAPPAQQKTETATTEKPKIACDEPEFDFGTKMNTEKVEHEFVVKNIGNALLKIDKVKTTCGCTVAQPEKKELNPGETTNIKATLNLTGRDGPQTKNITVESNDPENPILTLTLKGVAVSPIKIEPRLINYGTEIMDDIIPGEKVVELQSNMPDFTFNIKNVDTSEVPQFKAEVETVEPGKHYKVKIVQVDKIEPGTTLSKKIAIETDATLPDKPENDPAVLALRKIYITLYARFVGNVSISPEAITVRINHDDINAKTQQYLRIKEGREKGLKITEVIPPIPDIEVELNERSPGDYLLLVKNIPMNETVKDKEIIVKTTSSTTPEIKIPFRVIDIPPLPKPTNKKEGQIVIPPPGQPQSLPAQPPMPPKPPATTPAPAPAQPNTSG